MLEQDLLPLVRSDARLVVYRQHPEGAGKFLGSIPVSLLAPEAHSIPVESQRLPLRPARSFQ